jgi:hypothetical protein
MKAREAIGKTIDRHGGKISIGAIVAGAGMVGAFVNWSIETSDRLGDSRARQDSIVVAITRISAEQARIRKVLKIKGRITTIPNIPQQEGIARRIWHLVF